MSLCQRRPPRSATSLGYHRNCGGVVSVNRFRAYVYDICGSCHTRVHQDDIVADDPGFKKQRTAGVSRRIPRYDLRSWKDVPDPGRTKKEDR